MEAVLKKLLPGGTFQGVSAGRSKQMAAVPGKNNKSTEQRLRFALVSAGVRGWTLHANHIPGRPDFFFEEQRLVVFVDGCFWHGCSQCGHVPKKRSRFWKAKLQRNQQRDRKTSALLRRRGFRVLRFWEHELSDDVSRCVSTVRRRIAGT